MLRIHAALCLFTGSRRRWCSTRCLAGNIGQLAAPGTVVSRGDFAGAGRARGFMVLVSAVPVALAAAVRGAAAMSPRECSRFAAGCAVPAAFGLAGSRRADHGNGRREVFGRYRRVGAGTGIASPPSVPLAELTRESWHGPYPAYLATAKFRRCPQTGGAPGDRVPLQCKPWQHARCVN